MAATHELDNQKLAEAALAIISLTAFEESGVIRAWKGLDWELLSVLHQNGWIANPVGKQKSVVLTEEGNKLAAEFLQKHFGK
jgi:hypothetical protein